jgi:hypothetical protein
MSTVTGAASRPTLAVPRRAHLLETYVDLDDVLWAVLLVFDEEDGADPAQLWRLDSGQRVARDMSGYATTYRDGPRPMTVASHPDGSLTILAAQTGQTAANPPKT